MNTALSSVFEAASAESFEMVIPHSRDAKAELIQSFIEGAITEQEFRSRLRMLGDPQSVIDGMTNDLLKVKGSAKYGPSAQVGSASGFGDLLHGGGSILFGIGVLGGLAAYFNFFDLGFSWYTYVGLAVAGTVLGGIGGSMGGGASLHYSISDELLVSDDRPLARASFPNKCAVCGAVPERAEAITITPPMGLPATFRVPHCSMHKEGVWFTGMALRFRSKEYCGDFCRANGIPQSSARQEG